MKGLFIPDITAEMFRNCCLESIEELMAEGEIYDIEYDPKFEETDVPDINVGKSISRQAEIEDIKECAEAAHSNHEWGMEQGYINAIECLEEMPSAQPDRKKGKWNQIISIPNDMYGRYYCSECGKEGNPVWYFCPNCGADMRQPEEESE